MSVVNKVSEAYPWSRDCAALWEAAQRQSVLCLVDYDPRRTGRPSRDTAHTIWTSPPDTEDEWLQISARGICYLDARDPEELARLGEKYRLAWLPVERREDVVAEALSAGVLLDESGGS